MLYCGSQLATTAYGCVIENHLVSRHFPNTVPVFVTNGGMSNINFIGGGALEDQNQRSGAGGADRQTRSPCAFYCGRGLKMDTAPIPANERMPARQAVQHERRKQCGIGPDLNAAILAQNSDNDISKNKCRVRTDAEEDATGDSQVTLNAQTNRHGVSVGWFR